MADAVATGPTPMGRSNETLWAFMRCFAPERPGAAGINFLDVRTVRGHLTMPVLRLAVSDVMRRQEALRCVLTGVDADAALSVRPDAEPAIREFDLSGHPAPERARLAADVLSRAQYREFDLVGGPLWELTVIRVDADRHVLAFGFTHLIADGWSAGVLIDEVVTAYRARLGRGPVRDDPVIGVREVARLQQILMPGTPERQAYWREHLLPLPPLEPPFPVLRPHRDFGLMAEARCEFRFPDAVRDGVRRLAAELRSTPYLVLMAGYAIVVSRRLGWGRTVLGTTTMGRDQVATRNVVGQFTNNVYPAVVISSAMAGSEVVAAVKSAFIGGLRHLGSFQQMAEALHDQADSLGCFLGLYHSWFQSLAPEAPPVVTPELTITRPDDDAAEPLRHCGPEDDDPARMPLWIKRGAPAFLVRDDLQGGAMVYNPRFFADDVVADAVQEYLSTVASLVEDAGQRVGGIPYAGR